MALTLVSSPVNISNSGAFNITTSLVEDADHVNLRVRAEIYHEGIVKAIVEKPKGLADFDFGDILKSLTPGLKFARNGGVIPMTGTMGANLITGWAVKSGNYTTLTKAANVISSAICSEASVLETNAIAMTIGELYLFYCPDHVNSADALLYQLSAGGARWGNLYKNKGLLLMPTTTANLKAEIGFTTVQDFSGTFHLCKITTNRNTTGNLLAPYFVKFTEVFENANGVTATDATSITILHRYVPAPGDGTAFSNYVLSGDTSRFANKTIRNNIIKYYSKTPFEYWLCFFTEYAELKIVFKRDGGAWYTTDMFACIEGWCVICLNVNTVPSLSDMYVGILIKDYTTAAVYSEEVIIYPDAANIAERVVLEFDGLVGGKEYLAFEGLKSIGFDTIRNYYLSSKKAKKALSLTGINKQTLETRFKDMANADYLKSLLISEDVKKLLPAYAAPTPVTILTENVKIDGGTEMFVNRLDIEYEH